MRRATPEDAALLEEISIRTFKDTFDNTCTRQDMTDTVALFFSKEQIKKELNDAEDYYYLAFVNETLAAYMRIKEDKELAFALLANTKPIELKRLYVYTQFHGSGVAQALINFACTFAIEKKYTCMYLSVWEYNFKARGFYEKNGFKNTSIPNPFPLGNTPQTDLWFIKPL